MSVKTHKRQKKTRMHGRNMGTHGGGARKKRKGSGHRGGIGMAGTGKRADQKKTLITKLYGNTYFGKQGVTSRGTKKDKRDRINLRDIEMKKEKLGKKKGDAYEINLENYKILGDGEVKNKLIIRADDFSKSAKEKVEAKGGEIILTRSLKKSQTKAKEASQSAIDKIKKAGGEIILSVKNKLKST